MASLKHLQRRAIFGYEKKREIQKKQKVKVFDWPSMSTDINQTENLRNGFKWEVEIRRLSKIQFKNCVLSDLTKKKKKKCSIDCARLVRIMSSRVQAVIRK